MAWPRFLPTITMSLSLDGSTLALGGGVSDGVGGGVGHPIRVVDLRPDHWAEAACRLAGRNLTHEEWVTNIGDLADYRLTCPDLAPG